MLYHDGKILQCFILYKANIFIWTTFGNNLPFCNVNGFKKNQLEKVKSCKKWPGGKKVAEWEKEETKVCSGNKEALYVVLWCVLLCVVLVSSPFVVVFCVCGV